MAFLSKRSTTSAAAKNKVIIILNDNDMSISRPVGGLGNFFRKISTDRFITKPRKLINGRCGAVL
jgi:deoxyxylulose-5-phosphate synthase